MTTVNIQRRHWLSGRRRSSYSCAVAIAIKEQCIVADCASLHEMRRADPRIVIGDRLARAMREWDAYGFIPDDEFCIEVRFTARDLPTVEPIAVDWVMPAIRQPVQPA